MIILRQLLLPFQGAFSGTKLGQVRAIWFELVLLAIIVPVTSSISSNLLRTLQHLFGTDMTHRRFYTFMASSKLPWKRLWFILWRSIPQPLTDNRLVLLLDDFINPKTGRHIHGCSTFFDHAAKANQSKYPWAQNIVTLGLLKSIQGRWACLPLAFRFYLPKASIEQESQNTKKRGQAVPFQTKFAQSVEMLTGLAIAFPVAIILVVTNSWFGNGGLFKPARQAIGSRFQLLSRLRSNSSLFDTPLPHAPGKLGRPLTYGKPLGSASKQAAIHRERAKTYTVNTYGKSRTVKAFSTLAMLKTIKCQVRVVWIYRRTKWLALFTTDLDLTVEQIIEFYAARWKIEAAFKELKQEIGSQRTQTRDAFAVSNHLQLCMMAMSITWCYADLLQQKPNRRHTVNGRFFFAFSDVRRLIAKVALSESFQRLCPISRNFPINPNVPALLLMAA